MTDAEEIRMVLAEVAPDVAAKVHEPHGEVPWAHIGIYAFVTADEYALIYRAKQVVRQRRGKATRTCLDCAWAAFSNQDDEAKDRHARQGCAHLGDAS